MGKIYYSKRLRYYNGTAYIQIPLFKTGDYFCEDIKKIIYIHSKTKYFIPLKAYTPGDTNLLLYQREALFTPIIDIATTMRIKIRFKGGDVSSSGRFFFVYATTYDDKNFSFLNATFTVSVSYDTGILEDDESVIRTETVTITSPCSDLEIFNFINYSNTRITNLKVSLNISDDEYSTGNFSIHDTNVWNFSFRL